MADRPDPFRPVDAAARRMARDLLRGARHGALAYSAADSGAPAISRVAVGTDATGIPLTLVSSLSAHHAGLARAPLAALMVGEPGPRGDPLIHPRLMIDVTADFVDRASPDHADLRARWLVSHPKAALYVDFADFGFVRFVPRAALLNGGFGRATRLEPADFV